MDQASIRVAALDYPAESARLLGLLSRKRSVTLATAAGGSVGARSMCLAMRGETCYFQTDAGMDKTGQVRASSAAALCADALSAEGEARLLEPGPEFEEALELMRRAHAGKAEGFRPFRDLALIAVRLTRIREWSYDPEGPHEVVVDLAAGTAFRRELGPCFGPPEDSRPAARERI